MKNDKIILKGMRFYCYHGMLPAERVLGQWFEIDLELAVDLSAAGESDEITETVDYADLYERVKSVMEGQAFALIEVLAARLIEACFEFDEIQNVKVLLKKPQAPLAGPIDYAAVEMERKRGEPI